MEQFKYRSKARITAQADLIVSLWSISVPAGILILAVGITVLTTHETMTSELMIRVNISDESLASVAAYILGIFIWILFVIVFLFFILQIVAAVKLFKATEIGRDPVEALKWSRLWQNVTLLNTIFGIFSCILGLSMLWPTLIAHFLPWITVLLRFIGIYYVRQFIKELDLAISNGILLLSHHHHENEEGQNVAMSNGMVYTYLGEST